MLHKRERDERGLDIRDNFNAPRDERERKGQLRHIAFQLRLQFLTHGLLDGCYILVYLYFQFGLVNLSKELSIASQPRVTGENLK